MKEQTLKKVYVHLKRNLSWTQTTVVSIENETAYYKKIRKGRIR